MGDIEGAGEEARDGPGSTAETGGGDGVVDRGEVERDGAAEVETDAEVDTVIEAEGVTEAEGETEGDGVTELEGVADGEVEMPNLRIPF